MINRKLRAITIVAIFLFAFIQIKPVVLAMPVGLPPPPQPTEPPEPPPPDVSEEPKPPEGSPQPTPLPTPTPCIPDFCFIKHTDCCFMAGCIKVGPFKLGNCQYDSKDKLKTTSDNQPNSTSSFFSRFLEFFKSIF